MAGLIQMCTGVYGRTPRLQRLGFTRLNFAADSKAVSRNFEAVGRQKHVYANLAIELQLQSDLKGGSLKCMLVKGCLDSRILHTSG